MLKAPMLLAAVLVVCVASSADARRRHHHGYNGYGESAPTLDDWRRARDAQSQGQDRGQGSGQDQAQGQGQDQKQDQRQGQAQDSRQDQRQDRAQDRRDYRWRERGDRRRARSLDEWRRNRETQSQGQDSGQDRGQALARDRGDDRTRESYDRRRARYDEWRRDRDDWRRSREREDGTRRREDERGEAVMRPGRGGPFAAVVDKLVRGCGAQGAEFENWPFDAIAQIVGADEKERNALAALRESAKAAAQRLAADCPQDVPAAPSARLEAVEQGIDAALVAFDKVQPALATFYGALDDEQKARLYRDMAAPAATARETTPRRAAQDDRRASREYRSRRDRWRAYAAAREATAPRQAAASGWSATCEEFAAVLRNWPVREIERDVRLSSTQR
ncbi:MAG TPA: Spy/CpxP family protein refolding chaperone, partial [Gemmatimonadales bacterium]|nr:Spy/CpxP family protein refolding chaperone [Gemmatimonadales bacterium]